MSDKTTDRIIVTDARAAVDIVRRLREPTRFDPGISIGSPAIQHEAADEIERLRSAVERLREKVDAETRAVVRAQIETSDARRENRKILGLPS